MSTRDLHERASQLFLRIRDLPPGQRAGVLAAETGSDPDLRREVLSLLENDLDDGAGAGTAAASAPTGVPGRIGPYTVIRRIGHGGSGYVLLAEQHEPVQRRVAIKIVPHAAVSPELAARFEFERHALERTDHPNIARILDAGRTDDGLPYLVMDFVEGVPLAEYCREHRFGVRECIGLVLEVADAVQHAHQRGVIHRDLKPANILVSEVNGRPTPRVLDFGIAKPIAGAFSEGESPPTSGLPVGTPAYMAPEQTGGNPPPPIDTRADVYALGAVLYHLVAGRPPIDTSGDPLEALRRIRGQTPDAASRVRSHHGGAEPIPRAFAHDLDCILTKALEKEPARRYATVAALAEDLKRLLRRDPILAHPPTIRYRATRFAQRNRTLVTSVALVILALVIGVVGLAAGLIEAKRQRTEATNQGDAQREINRFLTEDLLAPASPTLAGDQITALDLLHRAGNRVDQRLSDRPLIAAAVHHVLATAFMELGAVDDADRHVQKAIELRRRFAGADAPDTVRSEIVAGSLLVRRDKTTEAEKYFKELITRARMVLGPDDIALYDALNDMGMAYEGLDLGAEAVALLQESLAGRIRILGDRHPHVLSSMSNLAQGYDRIGKGDEALKLNLEALKVADSLDEEPRFALIQLCNDIGATYQDLNRDRDAAPYLRRAAELAGKWLGPENPDTLTLQGNLAGLEAKLGDPARAAQLYDEVVKARTKVLGPDAPTTLIARYGYWDALWHAKEFDKAAAGLKVLLADMERALNKENHWYAIQTRALIAHALKDGGHREEAIGYAQQATDEFTALYGAGHARTKNIAALLATLKSGPSPAPTPTPAPEAQSQTPGG